MLSLHEIALLEEARQAVGTSEVAREAEEIAGGWMTYSGPGNWSNQACGLAMHGPIAEHDLDRLVDFYTSRGCEPRIEVSPFAHETLVQGLAARGFQLREFENVLARELPPGEDLRAAHPHGWPQEIELLHVDKADDDQVRTLVEVATSGFRPADAPLDPLLLEISTNVVRHPKCDSYLALVEGVPAGGATVESRPPAAGLFGTSVLPAFRRRGIQAALMIARLQRARELGCRLAVIHSRPGIPTERNAQRLGFFGAYTRVAMAMPGAGLTPSP